MNEPISGKGIVPEEGGDNTGRYHQRDFWSKENLKFSQPHYRLEKSARIIDKLAHGRECTLLDVGCGPATLMRLLPPNVHYYGIDIAINDPAPNLIEADFLKTPIKFGDRRFDIIIAQGVFEYAGTFQSQKFAQIAELLNEADGIFVVSYWNFSHRNEHIYWPFNNVQSMNDFRKSLACYFNIDKYFPASHNWQHDSPKRKLNRAVNMRLNMNIPFISSRLAVEYFFICSSRHSTRPEMRP